MTKGIDAKQLIDALNGRNNDGTKKSKSDLTETQQADALLAHVTAFSNPPKFKIADFVRYRQERRNIIRNGEKLHVVVGFIDPPQAIPISADNLGDPVTYRRYDTFIAVCDPNDKDAVLTYACDCRDLEPYPNGDRLKGVGTA